MTLEEIDRIKQGVSHAIAKSPSNMILKDLEACILTVQRYRGLLCSILNLHEFHKRERPTEGIDDFRAEVVRGIEKELSTE